MILFSVFTWPILKDSVLSIELPIIGDLTLPVIVGGLLGWLYESFRFRDVVWKPEISRYVGSLIRSRLKNWIPMSLNLTEEEFSRIYRRDIIKSSTGIYWRAVDRDESMAALKERFFENGLRYSTCFDIILICVPASLVFLTLYFFDGNSFWSWWIYGSGMAVIIAAASIKIFRNRHIELTNEQLERFEATQIGFFQGETTRVIAARRSLSEE